MVFFQTNAIAFASLSQPSMFLTVIAERVQQALDKNCEVLNIALHSSKAIDRVWSFSQVQGLWCLQSNSLFNKTVLKKACNENPLKWPFFQTFSVNAAAPAQVSNFVTNLFLIFIYALSDVINSRLDINAEDKSIVIRLSVSITVKRNARSLKEKIQRCWTVTLSLA